MKINSIQDLIDVLEYVQREWGNDSSVAVIGRGYVTEASITKGGTILLKIAGDKNA